MGEIIVLNALESNIGVSTVALTLAEKVNYLTNKSVCIVELDGENTSFSYTLEKVNTGANNIDNILSYIIDDHVTKELRSIIEVNAKKFKGADISVVYGSKINRSIKTVQLNVLFNALRSMYNLVIIDFGNKAIPSNIQGLISMNLLIVQPSVRYIESLKRKRDLFINEKTSLIVNNANSVQREIILELKTNFKEQKILGELPSSNTVVSFMTKGIISISKGAYALKITEVAIAIAKEFHFTIVQKVNRISRLLGKEVSRVEDLQINVATIPLGEILIQQGFCTRQEIDICLKIQSEKVSSISTEGEVN